MVSDRSPSFLVKTSDFLEIFYQFSKGYYCVSRSMKHNLEMLCEVRKRTHNSDHFSSTNICPHFSSQFETIKCVYSVKSGKI